MIKLTLWQTHISKDTFQFRLSSRSGFNNNEKQIGPWNEKWTQKKGIGAKSWR